MNKFLPFSNSQKAIFQLENVTNARVNIVAYSLLFPTNNLDCDLCVAVNRLYQQVPLLNTIVSEHDDGLIVKDVSQKPCATMYFENMDQYQHWCDETSKVPFQIHESLATIYPVVIGQERAGFFVCLHHLIADGWSVILIANQLAEICQQLTAGELSALEVAPGYAAYLDAETAYYASPRRQRAQDFWTDIFSRNRTPALLSEQTDMDYRAERYTVVLDDALHQQILDYTQRVEVSPYMLFMAVTAACCYRIHGSSNAFLGTLLLNRTGKIEMNTVGNFFNTAPVPYSIAENTTFPQLLECMSKKLLQIMRHQRYGYADIFQTYRQTGGTASTLFDVLVNYLNVSSRQPKDCQFFWNAPAVQLETLQVSVEERTDTMLLHYDVRTSRMTLQEAKYFHCRLMAMLCDAMEHDQKTVDALYVAPLADIERIAQWNDTAYPYPKDDTVCSLFEKQVKQHPERLALQYGSQRMTYGELNTKSNQLAHYLKKQGVTPGSIVGIMTERSFDMLVGIYAIEKCGAAYMPIGTDYPEDRITFMLRDSESPVLLTHSACRIPTGIANPIAIDTVELSGYPEHNLTLAQPDGVAYVIYTSGSTGTPKGALITHRSAINRIHWMNRSFGMEYGDVVLQKTPYTFDVSVWELFWWGMYGGTLAILPPEEHKDPEQICAALRQYKITKMHFVPSMLAAFLTYLDAEGKPVVFPKLKQVFVSGEALMPAHVETFYRLFPDTELINLYGPTECTVDVSCFRCPKETLSAVPIGKPIDNTQLYILDPHNAMVPIGVAGELCIAGDLVGKGYLNRTELTAEKFIDNPFGGGKLYKTGDLAAWQEDGNIAYLGRIDFQVKLHGQRIELGEIEQQLTSYPGISNAVVSIQKPKGGTEQLVAHYISEQEISHKELVRTLRTVLPSYMIPQGFLRMDAFPLTVSGKTDRKALPAIEFAGIRGQKDPYGPENEMQRHLCREFATALDLAEEAVGIHSNFFDFGGDSIRAIMLMTNLHGAYGFSLRDIYANPTPYELEQHYLCGKTAAQPEDYEQEEVYRQLPQVSIPNDGWTKDKCILLTGATGFLGVHILHELVWNTDVTICCLVRNPDKLEFHWDYMFDQESFPEARLRVLKGNLKTTHFDLPEEVYKDLIHNVQTVFHVAADVRHFGVWKDSYETNTVGTERVIEFCLDAQAQMHHVSTMSVNGYLLTSIDENHPAVFTEKMLYIGQRYKENVYAHSKYLAEKAVLDARQNGLRANIYRVGNLLWRRNDCKFQPNQQAHDFFMLTQAFLRLRKVPEQIKNIPVDFTAVDDCARAIFNLAEGQLGRVYHLLNPNTLTLVEYVSILLGEQAELCSWDAFVQMLQPCANDPAMGFMLAYATANRHTTDRTYPEQLCEITVEALKAHGFQWPQPSKDYICYMMQ